MRVVIVGGTRFIGPYVARQLVDAGHDVTVYHRGKNESPILPASVRQVRNPDAGMPVLFFPRKVLDPQLDIMIHMIPMGERDAKAAVEAFRDCPRLVFLSSGDVYLAYGRFSGIEPGPIEKGVLAEDAPLRSVLHPYRSQAAGPDALEYSYEKILVERVALNDPQLPSTVLRLPKVYGPGDNADLATMYGFRGHPTWRWTHGYVENVASAIVLAALHPSARRRIYNVGEQDTPTVEERLANLPRSSVPAVPEDKFNFAQDLVYDTSRIRTELGYSELVPYDEGLRRTVMNPS